MIQSLSQSESAKSHPQGGRLSFRARMWILFGGAMSIYLLLNLVDGIHTNFMRVRMDVCIREAKTALLNKANAEETAAWLRSRNYRVWGPGGTGPGSTMHAERELAPGNLFWQPASVQLWFFVSTPDHPVIADRCYDIDGNLLPFDATLGKSHTFWTAGPLSKWGGVFPLCAIAIIFLLIFRREIRRAHGECIECGYDLRGTRNNRCTECGAVLPARKL